MYKEKEGLGGWGGGVGRRSLILWGEGKRKREEKETHRQKEKGFIY